LNWSAAPFWSGLFVRPVAFVLSGEVAVAYFMSHANQGNVLIPMLNRGEGAVLYCFIFLFLAAAGAGAWSLDATVVAQAPRSPVVLGRKSNFEARGAARGRFSRRVLIRPPVC
jgi:hypothetical protein